MCKVPVGGEAMELQTDCEIESGDIVIIASPVYSAHWMMQFDVSVEYALAFAEQRTTRS